MNKKQIIRELRLYKLNSIFPVPFSEEKVLFKSKKHFATGIIKFTVFMSNIVRHHLGYVVHCICV